MDRVDRVAAPGPEPSAALKKSITDFKQHLRTERRLSNHSIAAYGRDLDRLALWCALTNIDSWQRFSQDDARVHARALHQRGLCGRSIQRALSAGRTFFGWLRRERIVDHDPFVAVIAPKTRQALPETLTIEQASQLVHIEQDDALSVRDCAIFELIYSSGLRLSELTALDVLDVDRRDATARVTGKGDKERLVPVGRHALKALSEWLGHRASLADPDETAMFVSRRGRRLANRSVQQRLKEWSLKQSLSQDIYPHMLRHSFASHMLQSSGDLRAVQELLGHANIATTQVYTHLDYQHLAKVYDASHPRAHRGKRARKGQKS